MAARTTSKAVTDVLLDDYDIEAAPPLTRFINAASVVVTRVAACAIDRGLALSAEELEQIECWLAAHMYCLSDQTYASKNTSQASSSFKGQTGMRLEMTNYGQNAMVLDYSGCLTAISKRQFASMDWLGKPESEQLTYEERQ